MVTKKLKPLIEPSGMPMSVGVPRLTLVLDRRGDQASAGQRAYILLPTLEELLRQPEFGRRDPIFLPGHKPRPDGWAIFGSVRDRGLVLH